MTRTARTLRMALMASAATALAVGSSPAFAQDAPPSDPQVQADQPPRQDDNNSADAEIIITAQKRKEVLLDIPQSVTVIGGDTLERQQATNFQDYLALVPGLSLESSTPGVTRITLRGANTGGVASTVAIYMDEVPFGSSTGLANGAILSGDFDPFDINRIEVLRGPQGTLYGASSLGGVLKYVSNAPELGRFEARAQVGVESTKDSDGLGFSIAGLVNVPLGEKAALRVNGFLRKDRGYIDSIGNNPFFSALTGLEIGRTLVEEDLNDRKSYGGRASLLLEPMDTLSLRFTAVAQNLNSGGSSVFDADPDSFKPLYGGLVQTIYVPEPTRIKYRVYSGTVDWDVGFANILSSTSYSTFSQDFRTDLTFALGGLINLLANLGPDVPLLGLPPSFIIADPAVTRPLGVMTKQVTSTDKFTQEVRLTSPDNDKFEWLAGLFYTHEKSGIDPQEIFAVELGSNSIATGVSPIATVFLKSKYDEYAAFGNATWHIAPRFDLTGGARLSRNKQTADLVIDSNILGDAAGSGLDSSETVFTYSVAPRFELSDRAAVYARVATGYRPGGPNAIPAGSPPGTPTTYDADRLTSYELGVKAQGDARLWALEVSVFHLDWEDIQLFAVINDTGINTNGGKARVNGLEISGSLRPTRGLNLTANGAYTDAKLRDDTPPATGGLKGDPLPWVPRWSGALSADYEFQLAGQTGFVGGTISRVGRRGTNLGERRSDGDVVKVPGYTDVDLRAGAIFGRFKVEAFARNLLNKRGITSAVGFDGSAVPNAVSIGVIRPRTIGLVLTADIGS